MEKDKRRYNNYIREYNDKLSWNISLKYSKYLLNNINKPNLDNLCYIIFKQYISELNSNKLNIKNKKYINIWKTMLNTINNNNNNIKRNSIKQLNYVSIINI